MPDEIWHEAARHYNQRGLSSLILWIAMTNVWNRINVATQQVAGQWFKSDEARKGKRKAHRGRLIGWVVGADR